MAKNWTLKEVYDGILSNDAECIGDAGKRFPFVMNALTDIAAHGSAGAKVMFDAMPSTFTARKLNDAIKSGKPMNAEIGDDAEDDEGFEEAEEKQPAKTDKGGKGGKTAAKATKDEKSYDEMSPKELFLLCKERGLEAKIKQPEKYYIGLLKKDDKAKAASADKEDDGWGDDAEDDADDWAI